MAEQANSGTTTSVFNAPDIVATGQDPSVTQVLPEGTPGRPQKLTQEQKGQKRQQRRAAREQRAQEKLKRTIEEAMMTSQERETLKKAGKGLNHSEKRTAIQQYRESFRSQHLSEMDAFLELHHTVAKAREELRAGRHWSLRLLGAPLESVAYTRTLDRTWEALKKNEANIGNRPFVTIDVARKAAEQSFSWKHLIKGEEVALDVDTLARQESASQAVQQLREIASKTSESTDPISQAVAKDPKAQAFLKDVQKIMFSTKLSPQEMQSQITALADTHGQAVGTDFAKGISIVAESLKRAGVVMEDNIQTRQTEAAFQDLLNANLTQEQRGSLEKLVQVTRNRDFYTKYSGSKLAIFTIAGAMHVPVVGGFVAAGFGLATSLYSAYYRVKYDEMMHNINSSKGTYKEGGDRNLLLKVFTVDWDKVNTSQSDSAKVLAYARIMAVSAATSAGAFILGHSTEFVDDLQNLFNGVRAFGEHAMNSAHNALSAIRDSVPNPGTGRSADVQNAFGILGKGSGSGPSTDSAKGALEGLWNKITNGSHHMQGGGPEDHVVKDTTSQLKDTLGQKRTEPKIPLPPHKEIPQHPVGDATAADTLKHDVQQYIADKRAGNFVALKQDINNVRADEYVVNNKVITADANTILTGHSDTANLNKLYEHIQEYDMQNPAKHADDALKQLMKDLTDPKRGDISRVPVDKARLQHALENAGMSKSDASSTVNKIINDWQNGQNITSETNSLDKMLAALAKGPREGATFPGTIPTNEMQTITVPGLHHFEQYSSGNIVYEGDTPGHNWQDFYTSVDHDGKGLIFNYNPANSNGAHQYLVAAIDHQSGNTFFLQNGADVRPGDMTHMVTVVFPNGSTQSVPSGVVAQWLNIDQGKIDTYAGIIHAAQYSEQHGGAWTNVVVHEKNLGPIRWTGTGGDPAKGGANDLQQIFADRFGVGSGGSPVDMRMGGGYFQNGVFHMAASNHNFDQSGIPSSAYQEQQVTITTGTGGTGPFPWGNGFPPKFGEHSTQLGEGLEKFGDYIWNHPIPIAGLALGIGVPLNLLTNRTFGKNFGYLNYGGRRYIFVRNGLWIAGSVAMGISPLGWGVPLSIAAGYVLPYLIRVGIDGTKALVSGGRTPAPAAPTTPAAAPATAAAPAAVTPPAPVGGGTTGLPRWMPAAPGNYNALPAGVANAVGNVVNSAANPTGRQVARANDQLAREFNTTLGVDNISEADIKNAVSRARAASTNAANGRSINSIAGELVRNVPAHIDLRDPNVALAMAQIMEPRTPANQTTIDAEQRFMADAIRRAAIVQRALQGRGSLTDQVSYAIEAMRDANSLRDADDTVHIMLETAALRDGMRRNRGYTQANADAIRDAFEDQGASSAQLAVVAVEAHTTLADPNAPTINAQANIDARVLAGFRAAGIAYGGTPSSAADTAEVAQALMEAFGQQRLIGADTDAVAGNILATLRRATPGGLDAPPDVQGQVIPVLTSAPRRQRTLVGQALNGGGTALTFEQALQLAKGLQAGNMADVDIQREIAGRFTIGTPADIASREAVIRATLTNGSPDDKMFAGMSQLLADPRITPADRALAISNMIRIDLNVLGTPAAPITVDQIRGLMQRPETAVLTAGDRVVIASAMYDISTRRGHMPVEALRYALAATGLTDYGAGAYNDQNVETFYGFMDYISTQTPPANYREVAMQLLGLTPDARLAMSVARADAKHKANPAAPIQDILSEALGYFVTATTPDAELLVLAQGLNVGLAGFPPRTAAEISAMCNALGIPLNPAQMERRAIMLGALSTGTITDLLSAPPDGLGIDRAYTSTPANRINTVRAVNGLLSSRPGELEEIHNVLEGIVADGDKPAIARAAYGLLPDKRYALLLALVASGVSVDTAPTIAGTLRGIRVRNADIREVMEQMPFNDTDRLTIVENVMGASGLAPAATQGQIEDFIEQALTAGGYPTQVDDTVIRELERRVQDELVRIAPGIPTGGGSALDLALRAMWRGLRL